MHLITITFFFENLITITLWHNERFSHFEIIYLFIQYCHKYTFGRVLYLITII